jgi:hypothetical protein
MCWVLQQGGNLSKLDPKSHEFIFVGIADGMKGYRYYNTATHWNGGKQSLDGESNQAQAQAPEMEMATAPHASETPSCIPIHWEKSAYILLQPLINYRMLNNLSSCGPAEWRHHMPTTEELNQISVDNAMIRASLEDDLLLLKEAKERLD